MYAIQTKNIASSIPENSLISVNSNISLIQDPYKAEEIEMSKIQSPEEEEEQLDGDYFPSK